VPLLEKYQVLIIDNVKLISTIHDMVSLVYLISIIHAPKP
jgi:hypothetical protein